nr:methyltransferase [Pseudomonadota bacterium]
MPRFTRPAIVAAMAALAFGSVAVAKVAPEIVAALANPARADQQDQDARRKAAEVLAFSGVKPGWQVVDFVPGSGYWTRIFTNIVGSQGHVYAVYPAFAAPDIGDTLTKLQGLNLANVTATAQSDDMLSLPAPVDMVWTVQNYHDIPLDEVKAFNASVFKALRKGGTYMIIDHADAPFRGVADVATLHRIDPLVVRNEVVGAGFTFVGESKVLANKADD